MIFSTPIRLTTKPSNRTFLGRSARTAVHAYEVSHKIRTHWAQCTPGQVRNGPAAITARGKAFRLPTPNGHAQKSEFEPYFKQTSSRLSLSGIQQPKDSSALKANCNQGLRVFLKAVDDIFLAVASRHRVSRLREIWLAKRGLKNW